MKNTDRRSDSSDFTDNLYDADGKKIRLRSNSRGDVIATGLPNREKHSKVSPKGKINLKKKKSAKRFLIASSLSLISILLILVTAGSIFWNFIFSGFKPDENQGLIPTDSLTHIPPNLEGITNILLLGTDSRNPSQDRGRSDSIMILSINTKSKSIKLISIMRDSYTYIPYVEGLTSFVKSPNKINAAYAYGGPQLALKTVNDSLRLDIKYYITVNMESMASIIDLAGGLVITLSNAEIRDMNKELKGENRISIAGEQLLNGRQAVQYARIRNTDSDSERTRRQRDVLELLYQKFRKAGVMEKGQLIQKGLSLINTNMTAKQLTGFGLDVLPMMSSKIEQMRLPLDGYYRVSTADGWHMRVDYNKMIPKVYEFIYGRDYPFDPVPTIPYVPGAVYTTPTLAPSSEDLSSQDSQAESSLDDSSDLDVSTDMSSVFDPEDPLNSDYSTDNSGDDYSNISDGISAPYNSGDISSPETSGGEITEPTGGPSPTEGSVDINPSTPPTPTSAVSP